MAKSNLKQKPPFSFGRSPSLSLAMAFAITLPLSACSSRDDQKDQKEATDGRSDTSGQGGTNDAANHQDQTCVDDKTFFNERVWRPVLQTQCMNCHNASGVAKDSKLVLVGSEWGPTYIEKNQKVLAEVAANQLKGNSILLLKPIGDADHGGGSVLTKGSEGYKAFEELIKRIDNPVSCTKQPVRETTTYRGMDLMSNAEVLRKASLNLVGRLPTDKELTSLDKGGDDALDEALEGMMNEEAFYERLMVLFNDHFLTDEYLPSDDALDLLDGEDYPEKKWYEKIENETQRRVMLGLTNRSVAREPLELISFIVKNHRSFEEVLTADYTVVNPYSARVYGIEATFRNDLDAKEFVAAQIPGIPHAGVLTSAMFMNRFPTTATNRNRHRSKMVYRFFLATDLEALASRPLDPTKIADHNPTLNSPSCTVCHANMDPVAGALQNWDARGRYRPFKNGWYPEMASPGFNDLKMPPDQASKAASWLAKQIVKDKRFAISIVRLVNQMLTGHAALQEPKNPDAKDYAGAKLAFETQSKEFSAIAERFARDGFEIRDIFKALVKSPTYRARVTSPLSDAQKQMMQAWANTRLLTPEQLDAKIKATLGYPWRRTKASSDFLLSTRWFSIFYGGIDSGGVVERITEPNGIMANIIQRMANEMACVSVSRDLTLDKDKRILLPFIETSFVPKDSNGFSVPHAQEAIRKNLVYLHQRLLGVTLEPNDPEIDRAYKLYEDVWADGVKKVKDKTYKNYLPGSCQANRDFWTGKELSKDKRVYLDQNYSIRSWMAVVNFLLTDYRFLHE